MTAEAGGEEPAGGTGEENVSEERSREHPLRGWFTRRPLRTRLSILTATAVTIAVVLCAGASWFAAQQQMLNQVRDTLKQSWAPNAGHTVANAVLNCQTGNAQGHSFEQTKVTPTVVFPDGRSCPAPGVDSRAVSVSPLDVSLAASDQAGIAQFREGRTEGGTSVLIYTVSLGKVLLNVPGEPPATIQGAVAFAQPLGPVRHALAQLALILLAVAAAVIVGSWAAALLVARTALKPVDRLTQAVEHIARTEEVGTTIPVEGEDEIARLSESFNSMSTALANSRERQSQLIADAGHELRTPLTSLRTNVDLMVRAEETGRELPAETRSKLLRNMKAQMAELSTLIGDLLQLARPSRPQGAAPLKVVAWHDLVARALDRARLRGPGIAFHTDLSPWYVRADPHMLERAVINLLDNAVKFSPPDSAIDVRLRDGRLTVRDRGPGIPAEELPYVFDRFWRSPSARQLPGSGLGLAIVAQTVRDIGGAAEMAAADPRPDGSTGGALATITLPGAPTAPPAESPEGGSEGRGA